MQSIVAAPPPRHSASSTARQQRQQFGFESRRWLRAVRSAAVLIRYTTHSRQLSAEEETTRATPSHSSCKVKQSALLCHAERFAAAFVRAGRQAAWMGCSGWGASCGECTWRVPQPIGHVSAAEDQPAPVDDTDVHHARPRARRGSSSAPSLRLSHAPQRCVQANDRARSHAAVVPPVEKAEAHSAGWLRANACLLVGCTIVFTTPVWQQQASN